MVNFKLVIWDFETKSGSNKMHTDVWRKQERSVKYRPYEHSGSDAELIVLSLLQIYISRQIKAVSQTLQRCHWPTSRHEVAIVTTTIASINDTESLGLPMRYRDWMGYTRASHVSEVDKVLEQIQSYIYWEQDKEGDVIFHFQKNHSLTRTHMCIR